VLLSKGSINAALHALRNTDFLGAREHAGSHHPCASRPYVI